MTCRIDELVPPDAWVERADGKEYCSLPYPVDVWSDTGFTRIEQVIRHKTTKPIFRVLTHTGLADVTADHSLLDPFGGVLKPGELVTGQTALMHSDLTDAFSEDGLYWADFWDPDDYMACLNEAEIMGFFFGDGSCGAYNYEDYTKYSFGLNNSNIDVLEYMVGLSPFPLVINDTLESSGVFKAAIRADHKPGFVRDIVLRYRRLFYNDHSEKVVPSCILNAPLDMVEAFMNGYYLADGDKSYCKRMDCKGKEGSHGLCVLASRLGKQVSINTRVDKPDIFRMTCSDGLRFDPTIVKKIVELGPCDSYVYDLQTSSHHFSVGVGKLVVHNTDSVMVDAFEHLGVLSTPEQRADAVRMAFDLGEKLADELSKRYKAPNKLEFEKVYLPWLLYEKKRYAGQMFSADLGPDKPKKVDYKGLQVVRTDIIPYVKNVISAVMKSIMEDLSVTRARQLAMQGAEDLLTGKVEPSDFIMSKKLNSSYKVVLTLCREEIIAVCDGAEKVTVLVSPAGIWRPLPKSALEGYLSNMPKGAKLRCEVVPGGDWDVYGDDGNKVGVMRVSHPHVHVAARKEQRCPGSGEKAGDRVSYVFRKPLAGETLQMSTAEDPEEVTELDYYHYFDKCYRSPFESIFELFMEDPYKVLFQDAVRRFHNKRKRQSEISSFFTRP